MSRSRPLLPVCLVALLAVPGVIPGAEPGTRLGIVWVERALIRSGPGTSYPFISSLERGRRVILLDSSGPWYRIQLPREGQGWIYRRLVTPRPHLRPSVLAFPAGFMEGRHQLRQPATLVTPSPAPPFPP
jgi:hypothetical protein